MYTTNNATREQALVAAAAAERVMERHECCKSQFKFMCFSCGEMINRGDKITKCTAPHWDGMRLRFRGADARHGLTMEETSFYLAETGTRTWVHIGCNPCYWDSLPEDSNEYSPPALRGVYTDWGYKISYEFDEWRQLTNHYDMEEFLEKHGYPQEKWMKDRIIHSVTRFQAIWRGYLCKKAYPEALIKVQAEQMYPPEMQAAANKEIDLAFAYANKKWREEWVVEGGRNEQEEKQDSSSGSEEDEEGEDSSSGSDEDGEGGEEVDQNTLDLNGFLYQNPIGAHLEILMDKNHLSAAIYSAEVIKIQGLPSWPTFSIKFHHDDEVLKYHWKFLLRLKYDCETFKSKNNILAKITGKLPIYRFLYP